MSPDLTANHKMSGAGLCASGRTQLSWVGADSWIASHPPLSVGRKTTGLRIQTQEGKCQTSLG